MVCVWGVVSYMLVNVCWSHACTLVCTWRGQRLISALFLYRFPSLAFETSYLTELGAQELAGLSGQQPHWLPCLHLRARGLWEHIAVSCFCHRCWGSEFGSSCLWSKPSSHWPSCPVLQTHTFETLTPHTVLGWGVTAAD